MITGDQGILLTEQSLVATITTTGVVLAAIITAFGTWFVTSSNRARRAAEAALHELRPNSGGSARDGLDRLEQWAARADEKLDADHARMGLLEHRLSQHIEQSDLVLRSLKKQQTKETP